MQEELDPLEIRVTRTGGALVLREIEYHIEPNGDQEFYGATNVMRFEPGETEKTATILAKMDGIPEVCRRYRYLCICLIDKFQINLTSPCIV